MIATLERLADHSEPKMLRNYLAALVPEYTPPAEEEPSHASAESVRGLSGLLPFTVAQGQSAD